jgi:DNA mismatch repair protein MutL
MPIKILDQELVSRIAAGEVVERPASVVKELVENSLDADASQVSVEIRDGGIGLIRVTDNGSGIPASELELAFKRHATSKIARLDDLYSISSLGFRGEALPSIAAVAEVELVTSAFSGNPAGSYISLKDGVKVDQGRRGRSQGTTVTVRDLFRNVPARLKFLKTPATENGHIANIVTQYALAYPEIRFSLTVDGRTSLKTPGSGRLIDGVIELYGPETAAGMLEIDRKDGDYHGGQTSQKVKVTGMVGSPAVARAGRNYMSYFVNRRWINSRLITRAVEEAYHGFLMQDKHPVAILNISIPPDQVDVNVHPTKTEVKFTDERLVFGAVQKAVRRALVEQSPVPAVEEPAIAFGKPQPPAGWTIWTALPSLPFAAALPESPVPTPMVSLPALRLLGQIAGTYIVAEGPEGLYIIDQHAAHERIVFEEIRRQTSLKKVEVQGLLEPATLEVSPGQDEALKNRYAELAEYGFSIEPFGGRTYLVRSVPALLKDKDWAAALKELLDSLIVERKGDWREKLAISIACHGAVRAGKVLSDDEMKELLRQLEKTALPNTCPHGRPTIIRLSSAQLEKDFHRT